MAETQKRLQLVIALKLAIDSNCCALEWNFKKPMYFELVAFKAEKSKCSADGGGDCIEDNVARIVKTLWCVVL